MEYLIIYLADISANIVTTTTILSVFGTVILILHTAVSLGDGVPVPNFKKFLFILTVLYSIAIVTPNKETVYRLGEVYLGKNIKSKGLGT